MSYSIATDVLSHGKSSFLVPRCLGIIYYVINQILSALTLVMVNSTAQQSKESIFVHCFYMMHSCTLYFRTTSDSLTLKYAILWCPDSNNPNDMYKNERSNFLFLFPLWFTCTSLPTRQLLPLKCDYKLINLVFPCCLHGGVDWRNHCFSWSTNQWLGAALWIT